MIRYSDWLRKVESDMGNLFKLPADERTTTTEPPRHYTRPPGQHGNGSHGHSTNGNMGRPSPVPSRGPDFIKIRHIDIDVSTNTREHHTDEFEITDSNTYDSRQYLVIRRGQRFYMNIDFDRDYNTAKEDLRLAFQFGKNPNKANGTYVDFMLSERDVTDEWGGYIQSKDYKSISLVFMTPPTCPVGIWRMHIDVVSRDPNSTIAMRYVVKEPIYILFNPWCNNDQVYFHESGEKLLDEYVLKDTGKLYYGSTEAIGNMNWDFGQFSGSVIDCVLYLLETLVDDARGDPVQVTRKLSAMINSQDDNGVLTGNWSGVYNDGTSPLDWTGSVAILEEYLRTRRPIRYGQCWVFCGLLTTACRALGIPSRSITNFNSAHDTDGSITIDTFLDGSRANTDSVWNFHCWNDAWMARPDLPPGYGGWQAIDSTPQEQSKGIFRLGPMSVVAVKRGDVNSPYDGKFVFAEVNADSVKWVQDETGQFIVYSIDKTRIGQLMSTKQPLSQEREDVTDQYKWPEGSDEERAAVQLANMASTTEFNPYNGATVEDVLFEIHYPTTNLGETLNVTLKLTNTSDEDRTINGTLRLTSMYYTGVAYKVIADQKINDLTLQSNQDKEVNIQVDVGEYFDKLTDHNMCKITSVCLVKETKQISSEMKELILLKPYLQIQAPERCYVGETFDVYVKFDNPLPMDLTECELRVEGPYLQRPTIYKQRSVGAYQTFTGKFEMLPTKPGEREMIVYFNCTQIHGINSSYVVMVERQ